MTEVFRQRVRIRPARQDEADVLLDVQRTASLAAFAHIFPPEVYPFPSAALRERWRETLATPASRVLVGERGGRVAGVIAFGIGRIDRLFVLPDEWGSGLAGDLHDEAVHFLDEAGCARADLWVLEANPRARRFYERRGWQLDGRRRHTPFPPHPPLVAYTRRLRTEPGEAQAPGGEGARGLGRAAG